MSAASSETAPATSKTRGLVYTFYSYKGGVGRSMALANVAAMLAKWGKRVLIIDWDLEAPGIEKYFTRWLSSDARVDAGLIEIVTAFSESSAADAIPDWRDCVIEARIDDRNPISILRAGRQDAGYVTRLRKLDWEELFAERGFGVYLERLRNEWTSEYDFVLVDSRTGMTDIGGICTIHLPDILVTFFTANEQSLDGVKEVAERARRAHGSLPVDRSRLLVVPVPSRDESNAEYRLAGKWRDRFADALADLYKDWIPRQETPHRVLDYLKIPYFSYWSFGEGMPVVDEDADNPKTLAFSYQLLARLIHSRLDWDEVRTGTRAVAAELEMTRAIEERKAERAAAEAEKARLAEAETFRRSAELHQRIDVFMEERLDASVRKLKAYRLRTTIWSAVSVLGLAACAGVLVVILADRLGPAPSRDVAPVYALAAAAFVGGIISWVLFVRARRRHRRTTLQIERLDRERTQFAGRLGAYGGFDTDHAFQFFATRVESIILDPAVRRVEETDVIDSRRQSQ